MDVSHLYVGFTEEADEHVDEDRHDVVQETGPVVDLEGCHKSANQHEEDVAWSENGTYHQESLRERKISKTLLLVLVTFEVNFSHKKHLGNVRGH